MNIPKFKKMLSSDFISKGQENATSVTRMKDLMRNQNQITEALVQTLWQPETEYKVGDIVTTPNLKGFRLVCSTSGTNGSIEPAWGNVLEGSIIQDGAVNWVAKNIEGVTENFVNNSILVSENNLKGYINAQDDLIMSAIDDIATSNNIIDIVSTKTSLNSYNTQKVKLNDIIVVATDETHNYAKSFYKWLNNGGLKWVYQFSETRKAELDSTGKLTFPNGTQFWVE